MEDVGLFLEFVWDSTLRLFRQTTENDHGLAVVMWNVVFVGIVVGLRAMYLGLAGKKERDGELIALTLAITLFLLFFPSCTETITAPGQTNIRRDSVLVVDTVVIGDYPRAVVRVRVLQNGELTSQAIITVVNSESWETMGSMMWSYPGFPMDGYYRFQTPVRASMFLWIQNFQAVIVTDSGVVVGRDQGRYIDRNSYNLAPFHDRSIWEATAPDIHVVSY